jgi:hypothetical protein
MSNIKVGRYEDPSITRSYAGWIEPSDRSWIIYTDETGKPSIYFAERDADGAVLGEPILL